MGRCRSSGTDPSPPDRGYLAPGQPPHFSVLKRWRSRTIRWVGSGLMERVTLQSQKELLGQVALLTLLFILPAPRVQGVVTLQVTGGAGAPGDSVDIAFSVSGLDTPAATAQADILVDNDVLLLHGGAV